MKVTFISKSHGWIWMRIETDVVCINYIEISPTFPPFKEMFTWLGRIRDCQLPASMMINEEGHCTYLIAEETNKKQETIEFSVKVWKHNSPDDTYLKTAINPDDLIASFYDGIMSAIAKQLDEPNPSFIVGYEHLNWDCLLKKPNKPQDWHKRLAIYGGAEGNYLETNITNFSLTLEQEYLVNLENGLNQIYRLASYVNKEKLGELVSFYQELAIDIALDAIDPDWYKHEQERLNNKYKIDESLKSKTRKERIEEHKKFTSLRQARLKTLKIGQIVDGTIVSCRDYGFFVDIGGIYALLHISNISQSPIEDIQKVFNLKDWVRATIDDLSIEKGRVSLSTKNLESDPGQMLTEPWTVYQNAEIMAEKYRKTRLDNSSQSDP